MIRKKIYLAGISFNCIFIFFKYSNQVALQHTGTEWHLSLKSFLRLGSNRPVLGPIIMAPISAAIPPMTWTAPLPASSCTSKYEENKMH